MLGKLVDAANGNSGLSLGREARKGLEEIKKLGDRSVHNRRYNAKPSDLNKVQDSLRLALEELANPAGLYPAKLAVRLGESVDVGAASDVVRGHSHRRTMS